LRAAGRKVKNSPEKPSTESKRKLKNTWKVSGNGYERVPSRGLQRDVMLSEAKYLGSLILMPPPGNDQRFLDAARNDTM
jgi:hypothetical protein